jgi:hypothetical protein
MILSTMSGTDFAALAARGDVVALRELRDGFSWLAAKGSIEHPYDALLTAEVFARLTAEHGEICDLKVLAGILLRRADSLRDDHRAQLGLVAEAVKLLTLVDATGDEEATVTLSTIAALDGSGEVFDLAARMTLTENPALETVAGAC